MEVCLLRLKGAVEVGEAVLGSLKSCQIGAGKIYRANQRKLCSAILQLSNSSLDIQPTY